MYEYVCDVVVYSCVQVYSKLYSYSKLLSQVASLVNIVYSELLSQVTSLHYVNIVLLLTNQ